MNIGLLASNALVAYLQALDPALEKVTNFYSEAENPDESDTQARLRNLPCVIVFAQNVQEFMPQIQGNYNLDLHVRVITAVDDGTAVEFLAMFEEVWGAVYTDTIIADLTDALEGFTAIGFHDSVSQSNSVNDGRNRYRDLILPINCCASDLE